jgi:hypothetical protein
MSVLTHFPKPPLSAFVERFGGVTREEAIAAATSELEIMRPDADQVIQKAIAQLEEILGEQKNSNESADQMMGLLIPCDQIVTLAGTYGHEALGKATRSLCDLLDGLLDQQKTDLASIRVHVQTIRMLDPCVPPLADEHVGVLLFELKRLLAHHRIAGLEACADRNSETDYDV